MKLRSTLLFAVATLAIGATAALHQTRLPTYQYYGSVLSAYDKLAFAEANIPLHCTELPSAERYVNERSLEIDYICFNTQAELDTHLEAVIEPQWERLAEEYPDAQRSRPSDNSLEANHWALYANSGYNGWLGDVTNGTPCSPTSGGVWSAWKDGNPNNLTLACGTVASFTLTTSIWS